MNRGPLESVRVSVGQGNQVQKYQARDLPAVQGLRGVEYILGIHMARGQGRALSDEVKYVLRDAKITQAEC